MADPTGAIRRYLYHGTPYAYEGLPDSVNKAKRVGWDGSPALPRYVSEALGSHWAADPEISNGFAKRSSLGWGNPRVFRAKHPGDDAFMEVPNKRDVDTTAIQNLGYDVAFRRNPDLALPLLRSTMEGPNPIRYDQSLESVIDMMNRGEPVSASRIWSGGDPVQRLPRSTTWGSLFRRTTPAQYSPEVASSVADELRKELIERNLMGLRYRNTIEGKGLPDRTSYIVLDSNALEFAKGGYLRRGCHG